MAGVDLGKQVGPLPLGAWLAVVGVGLGIGYYNKQGGSVSAPPTDDGTAPITDPNSPDAVGTGVNGMWTDVNPPTTTPPSVQGPPQDNDEWGGRAINWLIGAGFNPALSQSAIANGLQGNQMSVQQFSLWTLALGRLGAPPAPVDVVPPPVSVPGPTTTPRAPVATRAKVRHGGRTWRIRRGQTIAGIAKSVYGSSSYAHMIYMANRRGVKRPGMNPGFMKNASDTPDGRFLWLPVRYI